MEHKLSYKSLEPHLRNLRFGGCFKLSSDVPKMYRFVHTVYMRLVLLFNIMFTVQQFIKVYQVRNDADKVMNTMYLLLAETNFLYKQITLWIKSDQIEELLDIMKGPTFNQGVPEHQGLLLAAARHAGRLLLVFNLTALSTCVLLAFYPIILLFQGNPVEFALWLPFDASKSPQYFIVVLYIWIQTSLIGVNDTTMNAFIAFFLAQCKTQLSIVRLDLENVVERSKEEGIVLSSSYEDILQRRFRDIRHHYDVIINFCQKFQKIFADVLIYQFLISGWIMCTTAYLTVEMSPASIEFMHMVLFMSCILTELFLICFYGSYVYDESERLMESAYAMNWLDTPLRHRRELIIFMERIKRPIRSVAGKFIVLSNYTFVSILKSSYSFYAILKNSD